MNNQPYSPADHPDHAQSRDHPRFPPYTSEICMIVGDEQKRARLLNASYGGIGVMMEMADAANLRVGDLLLVLHGDRPTRAQVQWIQHNQETQKVCLGIHWSSSLANAAAWSQLAGDSIPSSVQLGFIESEAMDHPGR